jgi:hypothetical protein
MYRHLTRWGSTLKYENDGVLELLQQFKVVIALEPMLTVFFAPNLTSMSWCLSSKIDRLSSIVLETE